MININMTFRSKQELSFRKTHYYLEIPIVLNIESRHNASIFFIVDTGAFITIINRRTAKRYKIEDIYKCGDVLTLE